MRHHFTDRREAGRKLADTLSRYAGHPNTVVLGVPREGIPPAYEVAHALGIPLDVFLAHTLTIPGKDELGMGVVTEDGSVFVDHHALRIRNVAASTLNRAIACERMELERKERLYRRRIKKLDLAKKVVILVDERFIVGSMFHTIGEALRAYNPAAVIAAAPIGTTNMIEKFSGIFREVVCPITVSDLDETGSWYQNAGRTSDGDLCTLLDHSARWRKLG